MSKPGGNQKIPMPLERFIERFNHQEYWESHEVLEGAWRQNSSTFYKGLIIYASAFVHAQRGNPRGVRKQLEKARRYLALYAPDYLGLDVRLLLLQLDERLQFVTIAHPPMGDALAETFPFHTIRVERRRVRGDEPELAGVV